MTKREGWVGWVRIRENAVVAPIAPFQTLGWHLLQLGGVCREVRANVTIFNLW